MHTRAKSGYCMPRRLFLTTSSDTYISPIPPSYKSALKDPNWYNAMLEEYSALMKNKLGLWLLSLQVLML